MGHRVIGDQMTLCRRTADEIGVVFDVGTEDKKGGRYAMFGEQV
ncbi:hypothetical protein RLEG12_00520 (plasmid) [Rhizobium leguminosarum bv. trifolii CB782]|nr:hypothetical protein RLEG12_00520 [Rhizobium leguminosarum bv. trifolii CB782]